MEINLKKPKYSGHKVSSYFIQDVCICNTVVPTASSSLRESIDHTIITTLHHWHTDVANYSIAGDIGYPRPILLQ